MLQEKFFQKGFLVIEILGIILIGAFIVPFVSSSFDVSKLKSFVIWFLEIFFFILTGIYAVVGFKLFLLKDNKLKYPHLLLSFGVIAVFIVQISMCINKMSQL